LAVALVPARIESLRRGARKENPGERLFGSFCSYWIRSDEDRKNRCQMKSLQTGKKKKVATDFIPSQPLILYY
jgi:hypothetical protein